jgi:DsbC/DsbD-like thiol-disulfide interchange protein
MTIRTIAAAALATIVLAATARAQDPVHWTSTKTAKSAAPGGTTSVTLSATIDEGWHIYSVTQGPGGPLKTVIAVAHGQPFMLDGAVKGVPPQVKFDPNFGINVETYENKAEFTVPIKVDTVVKTGAQKIKLSTRYEACNASMCLPPKTVSFAVDMKVKAKKS